MKNLTRLPGFKAFYGILGAKNGKGRKKSKVGIWKGIKSLRKGGESGKGRYGKRIIVSADNCHLSFVREDICPRNIISKHIMLGIVGKVLTARL